MNRLHESAVCPACAGQRTERLFEIDIDQHHCQYALNEAAIQKLRQLLSATTSSYSLRRCNSCGLEYAEPLRAPNAAWYEEAYALFDLFPSSRWEFGVVLSELNAGDVVLEVGCGPGIFLERCRGINVAAYGLDLSTTAIATCRAKQLSAEVHDLSKSLCDHVLASPSVVAAFHVVEHLENPELFFRDSRNVVAAGGRLFVSVPSDRRPARHFGERDLMDEPPHHMSRWSKDAFRALGSRTGWRLRRLVYEPIGMRAAIWNISVAAKRYRSFKEVGLTKNRTIERAIRYLHFPLSAARAVTVDREMSGFSMLACFDAEGGNFY
jgi:2-polyprenyl-3-methyl-5-hydroxy-6-metoxy-1,4-benzoquinol methylase